VAETVFDYASISAEAKDALEQAFPEAAIDTEEGSGGRVHVKIVSPDFDGKSERAKQEMVWEALRRALGDRVLAVSFVLPYGLDELP